MDSSRMSRLFIHKLAACCLNNLQEVCRYSIAHTLVFIHFMQIDEANRFDATSWDVCINPVRSTISINLRLRRFSGCRGYYDLSFKNELDWFFSVISLSVLIAWLTIYSRQSIQPYTKFSAYLWLFYLPIHCLKFLFYIKHDNFFIRHFNTDFK